jgi:hypothetical protein
VIGQHFRGKLQLRQQIAEPKEFFEFPDGHLLRDTGVQPCANARPRDRWAS